MMLNPIQSERPTIFDIVRDSFFQDEIQQLSSSPPNETFSHCSYGSLRECPIIAQRVYNNKKFLIGSEEEKIYRKLKILENDNEIRMLVMCMYETYKNIIPYSQELIKTLLLITHLLTHREKPSEFTISRGDVENILLYSNNVNFNYINCMSFYGVHERFIY